MESNATAGTRAEPNSDAKAPPGEGGSQRPPWSRIAGSQDFKDLLAAKRRFILPATCFFLIFYFALPVLVGYAPGLMSRKVFGVVNVAYLFALSQFVMAWAVAALYVRAANRFDAMIARLLRAHGADGDSGESEHGRSDVRKVQ